MKCKLTFVSQQPNHRSHLLSNSAVIRYSALRPAARRLLSARPHVSLLNVRSRSITTQSIAFSRPAAASSVSSFQQIQRRWNSDEAAKVAAEKANTKAEDADASLEAALESAAMQAAKERGSTVDATAVEAEIESTEQGSTVQATVAEAEVKPTNQISAGAEGAVAEGDGFSRIANKRFDNVTPSPTIYIGNLFFDITAEDLKAKMEEFGVVEKAIIISDARGLSKGLVAYSGSPFKYQFDIDHMVRFGYVTFDSVEAAQRAINEMNQQIFEGRRVLVQFTAAGPRAGRDRVAPSQPTRSLYIGNLAYDLTDRELNELFKSVRNVIEVRVAVDRQTGNPRGFAHADFLDVPSAQAAFEILSSKAPHGRRLRVDFSQGAKRVGRRSSENKITGAEQEIQN